MEDAGPPVAAAAATRGDWRSEIDPMAREVMVKTIMKTLRGHLPMSDPEGLRRLQAIADGFERRFYDEAISKTSYSRKIAMLLIYVKNINQYPYRQENVADDKGKVPTRESSPGDEIIPQEFWDSTLYGLGHEDPTYGSTDDRETILKKRKLDCSSSWAPPLGVDDPSSTLAIPRESSTVPSWANQLQFQGWVDDTDDTEMTNGSHACVQPQRLVHSQTQPFQDQSE